MSAETEIFQVKTILKEPKVILPKPEYRKGEILIPESVIDKRISEMAGILAEEYKEKNLLMIPLLNGAFMFASDLSKGLWRAGLEDAELDFMSVGSYGKNKKSAGKLKVYKELKIPIKDRHILLVEDLVDSRLTLATIHQSMIEEGAASVKSCVLVSKQRDDLNIQYEPDLVGFLTPNVWIQGRGMDSKERNRMNPNIVVGTDYSSLQADF